MTSFYFDHKDPPTPCRDPGMGSTINTQHYQATLQNFRRAIKLKLPCMLSNSFILLHDNAAHKRGKNDIAAVSMGNAGKSVM
ncbi:hypothetical protein TNCV_2260491 [Trichonephila clavipes]|nr:hypothetical protein TNCV_2260491 [Trichonephila clavipes]